MAEDMQELMIEFDMQYDTGDPVTRIKDGHGTQLIDSLRIRSGGDIPIELFGEDLSYLYELLKNVPHGWTQYITTVSQADQVVEHKFTLPVEISKDIYKAPVLEISWNAPAALGTGYTVDSATINGTYIQSTLPVRGLRIIPDVSVIGQVSMKSVDIPTEGRLAWVLMVARANASPFAPRDGLTVIGLRIEGVYSEWDADNLKSVYSQVTGQSERTGAYLLNLTSEKPLIGNNSKLRMTIDATATDMNIYYGFVSPTAPAIISQPIAFGGDVTDGVIIRPDVVVDRVPPYPDSGRNTRRAQRSRDRALRRQQNDTRRFARRSRGRRLV